MVTLLCLIEVQGKDLGRKMRGWGVWRISIWNVRCHQEDVSVWVGLRLLLVVLGTCSCWQWRYSKARHSPLSHWTSRSDRVRHTPSHTKAILEKSQLRLIISDCLAFIMDSWFQLTCFYKIIRMDVLYLELKWLTSFLLCCVGPSNKYYDMVVSNL